MTFPAPLRVSLTVTIFLISAGVASGGEDPAPVPTLRIVLFTPADVEPPPGVERCLTQVADYTERFLVDWMKRWGYEPANKTRFRRDGDGTAEVLYVKGDHPLASGRYDKPGFQQEVIEKAARQHRIPRHRHVWWIFVYLGDPPRRFTEYEGHGDSKEGGWALVNYSTGPGEIRSDLGMVAGFHRDFTLKACIHELGHAFGLPHIGPNPRKRLGNSLMGPQAERYAQHASAKEQSVYLTAASAAMLWKHPLFSGTAKDRSKLPDVALKSYHATFDRGSRHVVLEGHLDSQQRAHSVVVVDDMEQKPGTYWVRGYAGRLAADGTFRVVIDEPVPSNGRFEIVFCFENGAVTGDGKGYGLGSAIGKSYRYGRAGFQLEK